MRRYFNWPALFIVVFIVVAIFANLHMLGQRNDCQRHGGTYVRTTFWYTCIGEK